jgi:nitrogenase molybdenum-iron protein alpha/beta subunit
MGLYKYAPEPSGRMGLLLTLGTIREAVILEYGSMGHMIYADKWMKQTGLSNYSKFYTTHIDEKEIALGITKRFQEAVAEIIAKDHPKVIFVLPSTVPETIGTDMEAICEDLASLYDNVRILPLKKGGFQEKLSQGIEEALYKITSQLTKPMIKSNEPSFNIIGSCADVTKFSSDANEITRMLSGAYDMDAGCILTSNVSITQLETLGVAHINLVLRKEGIKAAEELKKKFGTPYLYGAPYGYEGTKDWLKQIGEILNLTMDEEFVATQLREGMQAFHYAKQMVTMMPMKAKISLGGNYDVVQGIMKFACDELGMKTHHIWCDSKQYATQEIPYCSESELLRMFETKNPGFLMANPLVCNIAKQPSLTISRGLQSFQFNPYECPYMGFRGAMNLCAKWLEYLLA